MVFFRNWKPNHRNKTEQQNPRNPRTQEIKTKRKNLEIANSEAFNKFFVYEKFVKSSSAQSVTHLIPLRITLNHILDT